MTGFIWRFSNHSCQRVCNPLILWRPPYIVYLPPPFLSFVQPPSPLPHHLQSLPPLLFFLSCFFGRIGDCTTFDVLFNDTMDLHMLSVGTLYHKDVAVCFMQQGIKITEVWHIMWYFVVNLIWYHTHTKKTLTHENTHSTLRGQQTDTPI